MKKFKLNADGEPITAKAVKTESGRQPLDEKSSGILKYKLAEYEDDYRGADLWSITAEDKHILFEITNAKDESRPSWSPPAERSGGRRNFTPRVAYQTLSRRKAICRYLRDALSFFAEVQLIALESFLVEPFDFGSEGGEASCECLEDLRQGFERLIKEIETLGET